MAKNKNITIRDIARESKVSVFTVSSVLHNKSYVKKETREKVLRAIKKLNYNPLNNIPLIKNTLINFVGLVFPTPLFNLDPFFSRAIISAKRITSNLKYNFTLFTDEEIRKKIEQEFYKGKHNICFAINSELGILILICFL